MFRQEIGGDFHICNDGVDCNGENFKNIFEYLKDFSVSYFDSGRSALRALLEQMKYKKVLLPGYICESVRDCFSAECNVLYYRMTKDIKIDWNDLLDKADGKVDIVYLHFFNGYIGKEYDLEALLRLKEKYNFTIIEDTTHSLFSSVCTVGDYCVCSLRKWFPIADGGVLYSKNIIEAEVQNESAWTAKKRAAMIEKAKYLRGEIDTKEDFLTEFADTEHSLDSQTHPYSISIESFAALKCLDCNALMNIRKQNFNYLKERLNCEVVAVGTENQVPLFFTIRADQRDELRRYFISNSIYCPVHWPLYDELEELSEAKDIYNAELSIPIDQRYGEKEMEYICKTYYAFVDRSEKT